MKRFVCVCGIALALGIGGAEAFRSESRPGQSDPAPGEVLRSRVEAYWHLLASGDRRGHVAVPPSGGSVVFSGAP